MPLLAVRAKAGSHDYRPLKYGPRLRGHDGEGRQISRHTTTVSRFAARVTPV